MKKIIYMLPLLALGLAACDPSTGEDYSPESNYTSEQLASCVQMTQESTGNNNFSFTTSPAKPIQVLDATGAILATGSKGSFQLLPWQSNKITFRYLNQDGTMVTATKEYQVTNYTKIPDIYSKVYGSSFGKTKWTWDDTAPSCWGNGKYGSSTAPEWWTNDLASVDNQAKDKGLPKDGKGGWFTIDPKNGQRVETSRGETGSVTLSSDVFKEGWDIGTMTFNGTIPLMGIQVNFSNQKQYKYQVLKADGGKHLILAAPEPGAGDGGTGWFWCFKAE